MADAKRTIELIFEGTDKTFAATQSVLNNMRGFSDDIVSATQPLADFTAGAVKLEAALLLAGAAVTGFAISTASEFQAAVADLQKVLGDNENIEDFRDLALDLSQTYGVAATDVLSSIADFKQAGFTAQEAAALTKNGLDLVIAGNVEAAESSAQLVAALKGFGAEASTATDVVDILNEVSNNYAASTAQLLEGFSTLSPVAKAAGLSLEETIGILTPGIEVFQSGSEVANALRTSLIRLTDDSKPVQEGLEALGVSQRDANGELRSARDIYFDVATALQGVDDNQKLFLASQLVGIQRANQFIAVTDGLSKTLEIAGDNFNYAGSAAKEVAIRLETAEVAAARVKTAFTSLFIGIGTPLLDEFSGVADGITEIFNQIRASAEGESGLREVIAFIEEQFEQLRVTLFQVAENIPEALEQADFSGFLDGIRAVTDAVGGLFDGIDLSTPEGLAAAITGLGDAFEGLSGFTAGVIESFAPLFDQLVELADGLTDLDSSVFVTLGNIGGFATQANLLADAVGGTLVPALSGLLTVMGIGQGAGLVGSFGKAAFALQGSTGLLALLGKGGLVAVAGAAGVAIGTLLNKTAELATGSSISTWINDGLEAIGLLPSGIEEAERAFNRLPQPIENARRAIEQSEQRIRDIADAIKQLGEEGDEASDGVFKFAKNQELVGRVVENLAPIYDITTGKVIGYGEGLRDAGDAADDLSQSGPRLDRTLADIANSSGNAADKAERLKDAAEKTKEVLIALAETNASIAIAKLETDARKTEAAFQSINTTIEDTGDQLDSLFGLLGSENISKFEKLGIKEQIQLENERREKALGLQERLTNAQIKALLAQANALKKGTPLIKVEAEGLEPHLEAIWFAIMEKLQVRTSQEGLSLLLGTS
ncbi:MAG: hypothetical protein Hals2KO_21650 [Halioglobus sp.]